MEVTIEDGVDGGVIEDTYLYSNVPTWNFGVASTVAARFGSQTGLIKVDLTSLEGSTPITSHFG